MKEKLRNVIPEPLIRVYHFVLVFVAALWYRFPARSMPVIAITGTKGKSSTAYLTWYILKTLGLRAGLLSSVAWSFDGTTLVPNTKHMTMPGRFFIQQSLARMRKHRCRVVVVEVTSEGILQHRHRFLFPNLAIFTNLSPEHIESHGSFENYRHAKGALFAQTAANRGSFLINKDDPEADFFLSFPAAEKKTYGTNPEAHYRLDAITLNLNHVSFQLNDQPFTIPLLGEFQAYNATAAAAALDMLGFASLAQSAEALQKVDGIPGRMEEIRAGQDFRVFVDYAHERRSLKAVLETARALARHNSVIVVTGATGGGRDKQKRVDIGSLIGSLADYQIVTNEDPYDEDPMAIIRDVANAAKAAGAKEGDTLFIEPNRTKAIEKAISLADTGDVVLIVGKGAEQYIIEKGEHIPHDDRLAAQKALEKLLHEPV